MCTVHKFRLFIFQKHVNIDHLDHIGEIIASNPTLILNNDRLFVIFMKAICNANYKPEKWASFSSILLEHPALMLSRVCLFALLL